MRSETMRPLIWLIPIAGWVAVLVRVFLTANDYQGDFYKIQWDFDVYYYAAKAHFAGLNPYDPSQLLELAGVGDHALDRFSFLTFRFPFSSLSRSHGCH